MQVHMGYQPCGRILRLRVDCLQPGQARRGRAGAQLQELAASIAQVGVLQPLTVQRSGDCYVVISGNRRLQAARMAGLGEVPCILLDKGDWDARLIALTENLQRENLSYLEEADLLAEYLEHGRLTQSQAARKLGRSQSAVANKLRLLQHSEKVRRALVENGLSERHARALLRIPGEGERLAVLREIVAQQLNVAQTETYIDTYLENRKPRRSDRDKFLLRDTRLFLARISRDAELLRRLGINAEWTQTEQDGEIVMTVRIHPQVAVIP